jgi:hypothetical protein
LLSTHLRTPRIAYPHIVPYCGLMGALFFARSALLFEEICLICLVW